MGNLNGVECVEKCEIKCWADAVRSRRRLPSENCDGRSYVQ